MMRALILALGFAAILTTDASAAQPFFIVGDCVEYDTTNAFNPALRWRKGRITEIDDYFITIELDQKINDLPLRVAANAAAKWLRAAKGCAGKPGNVEPAPMPGDEAVPMPLPDEPEPPAAPAPPPPSPAGPFKVGDCIEYDTTNRYQPELRWRKGRVTEIDEFFVTFELDYMKSDLPQRVATTTVTRWLRPAKGCAPIKQDVARAGGAVLRLAAFQASPQLPAGVPGRPAADLKCPLKQSKASRQPDTAVLTQVIRCLFEKDSDIESVRVQIDGSKIGQPRQWNPRDDIGNGKAGTTVFPLRADWRLMRYYRDSIQMSENVSVFNCFVNAFDEWECGLASRVRDGSIQTYRRPR